MIKRVAIIAVMACTVFAIGKVGNIVNGVSPPSNDIPFTETRLEAPLSDPVMAMALEEMQSRYGSTAEGMGAKMTFRTASGPVTLYTSQINDLNQRYRRLAARQTRTLQHDSQMDEIRREQLDTGGWGSGTSY